MDVQPPLDDGLTRHQSASSSETHESDEFMPIRSGERAHRMPTRNSLRRHDSLAMMDEDDRRELERLATSRSRARRESVAIPEEADAEAGSDPEMDPSSGSFNLLKWLERIIGELRKEGITPSQTGVAFQDLNVSGTGDALQLQQTIGSWFQAPLRLGEFFSFGKKPHKTILHGFDGLVRSGELLIVLGRPGSGCSTLLKTMTGELHGLHVDDKSLIHYKGVPQGQMMKEFKGEAIYNQEVSGPSQVAPWFANGGVLDRSISTSLTSPLARPFNSPRPAVLLRLESTGSPESSTFRAQPGLSWPSVVSAIPTTPRWATTLSEVCLVGRESESAFRK